MRLFVLLGLILLAGCQFFPTAGQRPTVFNPFPQLSRVAVAPFFNLSTEPTADGRQFALQYYNELQSVPGFEVAPIGVVEEAMKAHNLDLSSPQDAQRLAQILGVDAIVIGAITDYSPYYPPRCGLRVEWYSANPCHHPIPPGYGLPWGQPEEEQIPERLAFEAEMAKAKAAMQPPSPLPPPEAVEIPLESRKADSGLKLLSGASPVATPVPPGALTGSTDMTVLIPPDGCKLGPCQPSRDPVLRHTRLFEATDPDFACALKGHLFLHSDARVGSPESYLQRSDDFLRFCCHLHIAEMLSARGGAGETRVVWRWPRDR